MAGHGPGHGLGMELGALALRGTIGPLFVAHGAQKLFGSFGGHGLEGTAGFFESLGLRPGRRHAIAAGAGEAGGGALLTLGALTPVGTSLITAAMVTAIRKVHLKNGLWSTNGGFEYHAVLIAALTALADRGPGRASVDAAAFPRMHGTKWALLSLAAGVAGSVAATAGALGPQPHAQPATAEGVSGDPSTDAIGATTP